MLSELVGTLSVVATYLSPFTSPLLPSPLRRFYSTIYRTVFRSSDLLLGAAFGAAFSGITGALGLYVQTKYRERLVHRWEEEERDKPIEVRTGEVLDDGIVGLIGNTPMVRIASLSELTGCEILAKCEVRVAPARVEECILIVSKSTSTRAGPSKTGSS